VRDRRGEGVHLERGPSAKRKGTAMYAATIIYWGKVKKLL
jgi:hypothetical protein